MTTGPTHEVLHSPLAAGTSARCGQTPAAPVVTARSDPVFSRAWVAGAEIVNERYETAYGSRDFQIRDPEGDRRPCGSYPATAGAHVAKKRC